MRNLPAKLSPLDNIPVSNSEELCWHVCLNDRQTNELVILRGMLSIHVQIWPGQALAKENWRDYKWHGLISARSPTSSPSASSSKCLSMNTETVVTKIVGDLISAIDSGEPSVILSLDTSPAFDTLDHRCLMRLAHEFFGFSSMVLNCCTPTFLIVYKQEFRNCLDKVRF